MSKFRFKLGFAHSLGLAVVIGLIAGGVIIGTCLVWPKSHIPSTYVQQTLYPVYWPARLPAGYRVDMTSYQVQDKALIFVARAPDGRQLVVTEQAKPINFDFANFYQQQLVNAKTLAGMPYTSVLGSPVGSTATALLSITTENTWLIITSRHTLSEQDARLMASHLQRQ
ncbi:MAG TPA: hypothetical protein VLI05_01380 [Candidatus Saccharimonadia bacterium]|nr:hypothetical protein [Candidatus Saccharimonadia bacterium]